jgi:lipopolysaccharide biosynthesis glycosyltransferase
MIRKSIIKIIVIVFLSFIYKYFNGIFIRKISVAYGLNNKYFLQTYISIISILENSFPTSFYKFYLLIDKKFKKGNKAILHNLEDKYKNCKFFFCHINTTVFFNIFTKRKEKYPKETFYRLLIANYIPDDRVIYLDGDTLIFSDLGEMYNLKMGDNYILGFADRGFRYIDILGYSDYKYITAGVLLIDLKNLRNQNITEKFIDYMINNKDSLIQNDQTVINVVLMKNIGFLPPKYGIWNFENETTVLIYRNSLKKKYHKDIYDKYRFLSAFKNPAIVHYVYRKPWLNRKKFKNKFFHEKWWNLKKKFTKHFKKTKSPRKKLYK